jgi:hypothetical protein
MLGPDIGMTKLARDREGMPQRALDPRGHADLAALLHLGLAARSFLLDLPAQIVDRDLELSKNRAHHFAVEQSEQEMLGIDLAAAELDRLSRRRLQKFLGVLAQALFGTAASPAVGWTGRLRGADRYSGGVRVPIGARGFRIRAAG